MKFDFSLSIFKLIILRVSDLLHNYKVKYMPSKEKDTSQFKFLTISWKTQAHEAKQHLVVAVMFNINKQGA